MVISLRSSFRSVGIPTVLLFCALASHAQFPGLPASGVNSSFLKLFGDHTNFSATADVRILDKAGNDWVRVPVQFAVMEQKLAIDVDISKAVSRDIPEFTLSSLKAAGMHQISSIVRPDKNATLLMYPGAESYVNLPLSPEEQADLEKGYKVEKEETGKESLAGKERQKQKIVVRNAKGGAALEATAWTAPELRGFPVQIETRQDSRTIILRFTQVELEKPENTRFEVPPGFIEYKNVQEMMLGIMKKIASGTISEETK